MSGKLIVTGFGPFGRFVENSSERLVRALETHRTAGRYVAKALVLPVEYRRSFELLESCLESLEHSAVLCFGLADGDEFRLERTALNRGTSEVADSAGVKTEGTIVREAPPSLESRLPLDAIAAALGASKVPYRWSSDAGGYVCNDLFFRLLHAHAARKACGLIHVPPLERMPEERLVEAGATIVQVVATSR